MPPCPCFQYGSGKYCSRLSSAPAVLRCLRLHVARRGGHENKRKSKSQKSEAACHPCSLLRDQRGLLADTRRWLFPSSFSSSSPVHVWVCGCRLGTPAQHTPLSFAFSSPICRLLRVSPSPRSSNRTRWENEHHRERRRRGVCKGPETRERVQGVWGSVKEEQRDLTCDSLSFFFGLKKKKRREITPVFETPATISLFPTSPFPPFRRRTHGAYVSCSAPAPVSTYCLASCLLSHPTLWCASTLHSALHCTALRLYRTVVFYPIFGFGVPCPLSAPHHVSGIQLAPPPPPPLPITHPLPPAFKNNNNNNNNNVICVHREPP